MNKNEANIWLFLRKMRVPLLVLNIFHAIPVTILSLVPAMDADGNEVSLSIFDAMYIVAYTITTTGFGEVPYEFTQLQRFVIFLTIYGAVPAWIFSLGYMISLFQDKAFIYAIKLNNFTRQVKKLKQDFIIICGYNNTSRLLIERLLEDRIYRIVVVDKNAQKIEQLAMESYTPTIPAIVADASQTDVLKSAGVLLPNCKFVVTIFDDDQLNLKTAVRAQILNSEIKIVATSLTRQGEENLINIGVDHVIDPFEIIASKISLSYRSPHLFNLLNWINGGNLNISKNDILPKGKHIICSGGRFGLALKRVLDEERIENELIDINKTTAQKQISDKELLIKAGIKESECIVAGTNDDAINLSIISTARKINPDIYTIVRENDLEERSMFSHLRVHKVFILDRISALSAYNFIDRPLAFRYISALKQKSNAEIERHLLDLIKNTNKKPELVHIHIDPHNSFALCELLKNGEKVTLKDLIIDPLSNGKDIEVVILAIMKYSGEFILYPVLETELSLGDTLLSAGTLSSLDQLDMIINNHNELYFALYKKEISHTLFTKLRSLRKPSKQSS